MTKEYIKDIPNWEEQYLASEPQLTVREKELLKGDPIKSNEGMVYGRMYNDWKEKRIKQTLND
jgi:hypothetical protein|tara:strand:- start:291 stop:479 length:189 start_codon:yes stop_codon:yes gene_type:complete